MVRLAVDGSGRRPRPAAPLPSDKAVGPIRFIRAMRRNPLTLFARRHYEEPLIIFPTIIGNIAAVNDGDAIRRVLVDNRENYVRDSFQQRMLAPMVSNSLITRENEEWRRQRKSLPPLFSLRRLDGFIPGMARAADEVIAKLGSLPDGTVLDTPLEMAEATIGVLSHTIFGDGIPGDHRETAARFARYVDLIGRIDPADALGLPDWVPRWSLWRTKRLRATFPRFVADIRAKRQATSPSEAPEDVVSVLLDKSGAAAPFDDSEIAGNLMLFFSAGYETTASAMTWAAYLLSIDPFWRHEVEREADQQMPDGRFPAQGSERFPFARAVIEEALRLYPPVAVISRQAVSDDLLCGEKIKAGTIVIISTWLLHRHHLLWRDADLFDPARFLGPGRERIGRYAYLPFGAGPRVCVAANFAMTMAVVLLTSFVRRFRLEAVPGHKVWPQHRVTLRPQHGLPLSLRHRRS